MAAARRRSHAAGSARAWRDLEGLAGRRVNFTGSDRSGSGDPGWEVGATRRPRTADGWRFDASRQALPREPPGPPVPDGSWEIARQLVADYAFADPRIVQAVYDPTVPLPGRDMLLVGRFFGLRFHMGVRVGGVVDERTDVNGRPVRVWGWDYETLEGHLEAGRMDYLVWKWLDTGEVDFRMRRVVRAGAARGGIVRVGWLLFGRWMQDRFVRHARRRMARLVPEELARRQASGGGASAAN